MHSTPGSVSSGGRALLAFSEKLPSHNGTQTIPSSSQNGSPLILSSPNLPKNILLTGHGNQLHLQTCQKLPDSSQRAVGPPGFPALASYSHLCELLGRKTNPVPRQAAVGGPSTLASWPANHSSLHAALLPGRWGPETPLRVRRRLGCLYSKVEEGASSPTSPSSPQEMICIP